MFLKKHLKMSSGLIGGIITVVGVVGLILLSYDLLFSKPDHKKGVIIEKVFVPAHIVSGGPYGGMRRGNYTITTATEEQWIAIVKTETGDTLNVHCHSSHYETTKVGDTIHFERYEGKLFHIQYFAHNEED